MVPETLCILYGFLVQVMILLLFLDECSPAIWDNETNRELKQIQLAKKVVSDSPGLVDFAIGLVNSAFNLPDGQVMFFLEFWIKEEL